jgi:hypothetical protein
MILKGVTVPTLIWIDTTSGTWGDVDGSNGVLVLCQVTKEQIDLLEHSSDSEISDFGLAHGLMPTMPEEIQPNA